MPTIPKKQFVEEWFEACVRENTQIAFRPKTGDWDLQHKCSKPSDRTWKRVVSIEALWLSFHGWMLDNYPTLEEYLTRQVFTNYIYEVAPGTKRVMATFEGKRYGAVNFEECSLSTARKKMVGRKTSSRLPVQPS